MDYTAAPELDSPSAVGVERHGVVGEGGLGSKRPPCLGTLLQVVGARTLHTRHTLSMPSYQLKKNLNENVRAMNLYFQCMC